MEEQDDTGTKDFFLPRQTGDELHLPLKVIAALNLLVADRIAILMAMGNAKPQKGLPVKYKVLPIDRYCDRLLKRDDVNDNIKIGAREILIQQTLLRPSVPIKIMLGLVVAIVSAGIILFLFRQVPSLEFMGFGG